MFDAHDDAEREHVEDAKKMLSKHKFFDPRRRSLRYLSIPATQVFGPRRRLFQHISTKCQIMFCESSSTCRRICNEIQSKNIADLCTRLHRNFDDVSTKCRRRFVEGSPRNFTEISTNFRRGSEIVREASGETARARPRPEMFEHARDDERERAEDAKK